MSRRYSPADATARDDGDLTLPFLRCVTLVTAAAAIARFECWFDFNTVEQGPLEPMLASAWQASATAGRPTALCRPASATNVFVRFVAGDPVPAYRPTTVIPLGGSAVVSLCGVSVSAIRPSHASPAGRDPRTPICWS